VRARRAQRALSLGRGAFPWPAADFSSFRVLAKRSRGFVERISKQQAPPARRGLYRVSLVAERAWPAMHGIKIGRIWFLRFAQILRSHVPLPPTVRECPCQLFSSWWIAGWELARGTSRRYPEVPACLGWSFCSFTDNSGHQRVREGEAWSRPQVLLNPLRDGLLGHRMGKAHLRPLVGEGDALV